MKLNMRQSDTGMAVQQTAKHPFLRALASLFRVRTVHYQPFPAHEPQPSAEPLASAPFMAPRMAQIIPFPTPAGTLPTRKPPCLSLLLAPGSLGSPSRSQPRSVKPPQLDLRLLPECAAPHPRGATVCMGGYHAVSLCAIAFPPQPSLARYLEWPKQHRPMCRKRLHPRRYATIHNSRQPQPNGVDCV